MIANLRGPNAAALITAARVAGTALLATVTATSAIAQEISAIDCSQLEHGVIKGNGVTFVDSSIVIGQQVFVATENFTLNFKKGEGCFQMTGNQFLGTKVFVSERPVKGPIVAKKVPNVSQTFCVNFMQPEAKSPTVVVLYSGGTHDVSRIFSPMGLHGYAGSLLRTCIARKIEEERQKKGPPEPEVRKDEVRALNIVPGGVS